MFRLPGLIVYHSGGFFHSFYIEKSLMQMIIGAEKSGASGQDCGKM